MTRYWTHMCLSRITALSLISHRGVSRTRFQPRLCLLENRITPSTYTVLNNNESGAGSLRHAISNSNSNPGADTIEFDPTFFGVPRTITLLTGELFITDSLNITGPGAGLLTVSGNNASRVFRAD